MNKSRRKSIQDIIDRLIDLKADIEAIQEEEQAALDAMPESLRDGERGEKSQEAVDALESAASAVDDVKSELEEASK